MSWDRQAFVCSEMDQKGILPPRLFSKVFEDSDITNEHEAFLCLLHVLILEERFIPVDQKIPSKKPYSYTISYMHPTTGSAVCHLKYLPLGSAAMIFGVVQNKEVCKMKLNLQDFKYPNQQTDWSKIFQNFSNLSILFKNVIVFKVINGLQELVDIHPTFGLAALATELKLQFLQNLDARSLTIMSVVNQEFHNLVEDPKMWQFMLNRDFPNSVSDNCTWKEVYKKEYEKKKKADELATYFMRHDPIRNPFIRIITSPELHGPLPRSGRNPEPGPFMFPGGFNRIPQQPQRVDPTWLPFKWI